MLASLSPASKTTASISYLSSCGRGIPVGRYVAGDEEDSAFIEQPASVAVGSIFDAEDTLVSL